MSKKSLKTEILAFIKKYGKEIQTKITNVCEKTGRYNVPKELYQVRTARKNRILISWKAVKNNKLTIEQLESCEGRSSS